jgi:endonuclease/exonuclease/phosphatase family metal-dependent hydrolase
MALQCDLNELVVSLPSLARVERVILGLLSFILQDDQDETIYPAASFCAQLLEQHIHRQCSWSAKDIDCFVKCSSPARMKVIIDRLTERIACSTAQTGLVVRQITGSYPVQDIHLQANENIQLPPLSIVAHTHETVQALMASFDMPICQTYIAAEDMSNPNDSQERLLTLHWTEEGYRAAKSKQMCVKRALQRDTAVSIKARPRLAKYEARGYTMSYDPEASIDGESEMFSYVNTAQMQPPLSAAAVEQSNCLVYCTDPTQEVDTSNILNYGQYTTDGDIRHLCGLTNLRTLTLNVWSDPFMREQRAAVTVNQLRDYDVVCLQEVTADFVAALQGLPDHVMTAPLLAQPPPGTTRGNMHYFCNVILLHKRIFAVYGHVDVVQQQLPSQLNRGVVTVLLYRDHVALPLVTITNVHLESHPDQQEVRNEQLQYLTDHLRMLTDMNDDEQEAEVQAVVITGDGTPHPRVQQQSSRMYPLNIVMGDTNVVMDGDWHDIVNREYIDVWLKRETHGTTVPSAGFTHELGRLDRVLIQLPTDISTTTHVTHSAHALLGGQLSHTPFFCDKMLVCENPLYTVFTHALKVRRFPRFRLHNIPVSDHCGVEFHFSVSATV